MTTTPELRRAARVIVLDQNDRVLLLRIEDHGRVFWATPGGSLDPGESEQTAARREVAEELGIHRITLSPALAHRSKEHLVGDTMRHQSETYFLTRLNAELVDASHGTQTDNIQSRRWWHREDIESATEPVYPIELNEIIQSYLKEGPQTILSSSRGQTKPTKEPGARLAPGRK